jgi:hypothetical protein
MLSQNSNARPDSHHPGSHHPETRVCLASEHLTLRAVRCRKSIAPARALSPERRGACVTNTRQGHQARSPLSRLPTIRQSNQLPPAPVGAVHPADPPFSPARCTSLEVEEDYQICVRRTG